MIDTSIIVNIKDLFYLGAIMLSFYLFYKERSKLLDRIMSRDYQQYEYYEKEYGGEVKEVKEIRDEAREEIRKEKDIEKVEDEEYEKEKEFLRTSDEDWSPDEVDLVKLRKKLEVK